jgi:hypothetical protein
MLYISETNRCKQSELSPYGESLTMTLRIGYLEEWLEETCSHYCLIMIDKVYKWMNSKVVPLW